MKRLLLLFAVLLVVSAGCIFDEDSKEKGDAHSIEELSMGGGVFLMGELGYGIAEVGVFDDSLPFKSAEVYVNSVKLTGKSGIYSNTSQIPIDQLSEGEKIRIAVHAFGDSVVKEIVIPEQPVIIKPVAGYTSSIQDSLEVEVEYPGEHQLIAITLSEQEKVAFGAETSEQWLKIIIPDEKLIKPGYSILNAYAANTSGDIPDNFQITNQFEVFLVASLALRTIEFVE